MKDKSPSLRRFLIYGGLAGAGVGAAAGFVLLAMSGGGSLAAGPIAVALLSGAAIGAAIGGLAGGLVGLKVRQPEATPYEGGVRHCNIMISLQANDPDQFRRMEDIFDDTGKPGTPLRPMRVRRRTYPSGRSA